MVTQSRQWVLTAYVKSQQFSELQTSIARKTCENMHHFTKNALSREKICMKGIIMRLTHRLDLTIIVNHYFSLKSTQAMECIHS